MDGARRVTVSLAGFVLLCFFLPWVQVSCLGLKDSASGFDLSRSGERALWLIPLLMLATLLVGLMRTVWERMPALFALCSMVSGGLSAWLMYRERLSTGRGSALLAAFWTTWFWLGLVGSIAMAGTALWFYARQVRAP